MSLKRYTVRGKKITPPPPEPKQTCIRNKAEPDVTIVVGGVVFKEYGPSLRCWSQYFDTALDIGMKESATKHFEFPHRDPKEWEWIVSLMAPLSTVKITKDKLLIALSWFDELCSRAGLEECDRVISNVLEPLAAEQTEDVAAAIHVVEALETSVQYGLIHSQENCFELLHMLLTKSPNTFSEDSLRRMVLLVKGNEKCRDSLMKSLGTFLPKSMTAKQQELLIEHDILHHYLQSEIALKTLKPLVPRLVEIVNERVSPSYVRYFKNDGVVGHLFE
ncbi:expressed unknown protein [Seminavis robusta]|uniref:BTB domain-containing protein n=1 Tax=Seminavis robusta TaxID=568900 RepID=A0A9N8EE44_9STRA|nr:expressed unknown protein [Seminavis robusta]|eukprot:Sro862_g212370.1 n/a (276) ;mRNA; r:3829-4656